MAEEHITEYTYGGKRVTVVDKYDGMWVHKEGTEIKKGIPSLYEPVSMGQVISISSPPPAKEAEEAKDESKNSFKINDASKSEIAAQLNGVGKIFASRIFDRKPEGGYTSWEHLIEVNNDLSIGWDAVRADAEATVSFES